MTETKTGLELLRGPFPPHQISKLPKGTKAQNECPYEQKRKCAICGGFHHPQIIHLDYVGHAALTDRLLDSDPLWSWEPMALKDGLPAFDASGGLWIKLTVCGHSRIGYGHAAASSFKEIGSREKEVIGDALRNAAMRFGAALDLWHKGDLHIASMDEDSTTANVESQRVYSVSRTQLPVPNINAMVDEIPPFEITQDESGGLHIDIEGKSQEGLLVAGSALHKTIEGLIVQYEMNRDIFKQWLMEKKKIGLKDDRPSLMTMSVVDANNMILKWNPTVTSYQKWLSKQGGE